jgi:hypothetical protein
MFQIRVGLCVLVGNLRRRGFGGGTTSGDRRSFAQVLKFYPTLVAMAPPRPGRGWGREGFGAGRGGRGQGRTGRPGYAWHRQCWRERGQQPGRQDQAIPQQGANPRVGQQEARAQQGEVDVQSSKAGKEQVVVDVDQAPGDLGGKNKDVDTDPSAWFDKQGDGSSGL